MLQFLLVWALSVTLRMTCPSRLGTKLINKSPHLSTSALLYFIGFYMTWRITEPHFFKTKIISDIHLPILFFYVDYWLLGMIEEFSNMENNYFHSPIIVQPLRQLRSASMWLVGLSLRITTEGSMNAWVKKNHNRWSPDNWLYDTFI